MSFEMVNPEGYAPGKPLQAIRDIERSPPIAYFWGTRREAIEHEAEYRDLLVMKASKRDRADALVSTVGRFFDSGEAYLILTVIVNPGRQFSPRDFVGLADGTYQMKTGELWELINTGTVDPENRNFNRPVYMAPRAWHKHRGSRGTTLILEFGGIILADIVELVMVAQDRLLAKGRNCWDYVGPSWSPAGSGIFADHTWVQIRNCDGFLLVPRRA